MNVETQKKSNSKLKAWIHAMRLRTLPLALASTLTGAFLVLKFQPIDGVVLFLTLLTTIFLQVNSNLANDYGDFSHGTDNEERVGPERALQSGVLEAAEMRRAILICSVLSLISGAALLYFAPLELWLKGLLFVMGLAAIYASVRYTAGSNPYGYRGLGDVSVMAFFGILGVVGAYVCQTGSFDAMVLLPAIAIGAFSTGVLNVNNTRDLEADQRAGKMTIAVKLGPIRSRYYHIILLVSGILALSIYAAFRFDQINDWLFLLALPLFVLNGVKVYTIRQAEKLDPFLKQLALSTFLLSLLLGIGLSI